MSCWRTGLNVLIASVIAIALTSNAIALEQPVPGGPNAVFEGNAGSPVDVVIREAPPPRRVVALEWNPVSLFTIGKLSGNVVIAPIEHHAVVLSPFYARTSTAPVYVFDAQGNASQLPEQRFSGYGSEVGYRYYFGRGGPRGFFFGPSLILASFKASAADGKTTRYGEYGFAADAGYQMLVADDISLSLGGGVQGVWTTRSIPEQQFPAKIYANRKVLPRVLLSLGWAF